MNDLQQDVLRLKNERKALILAHFYQDLDIQAVADVVGDSFDMAKRAATSDSDLLVVCGVRFMAESAKILSPHKTVLLPRADAGCVMADMIEPQDVRDLKALYPDAAVMCYVNSSAAVKAECDVCCTSSSAVKIAKALDADTIIFVPDQNLGAYVAQQVPEKRFIYFDGCCPIHHHVTLETLEAMRRKLPNALVLVHPECRPDVVAAANFVGSTSQMIDRVRHGDERAYIVGTEMTITDLLRESCGDKVIYPLATTMVCSNMRKTRLEDVQYALQNNVTRIELTDAELNGARKTLEAMIELGSR